MLKIVLKIELLPNSVLKINLYHLDDRFISDPEHGIDYLHFSATDSSFYIYSNKTLSIFNNSLRLPERSYYRKEQSSTHKFLNDEDRYFFLANLNKCLTEWSNNYKNFKTDNHFYKKNKKIIFSKKYWAI